MNRPNKHNSKRGKYIDLAEVFVALFSITLAVVTVTMLSRQFLKLSTSSKEVVSLQVAIPSPPKCSPKVINNTLVRTLQIGESENGDPLCVAIPNCTADKPKLSFDGASLSCLRREDPEGSCPVEKTLVGINSYGKSICETAPEDSTQK